MSEVIKTWQERAGYAADAPITPTGHIEQAMHAEIGELRTKLEAMRKDAERYRWLRDGGLCAMNYKEHEFNLESIIPSGWRFYSADFSRGITGTVMLCRDPAGFVKFHALPIPSAEREAFQLYVSGTGKTFSDAIADAVSEIEKPKAPDA